MYRSSTSLIRCIPKYVIVFDTIVNGVVFFFRCLLVYRNATDFCMLILYTAALLNSLVHSNSFFWLIYSIFSEKAMAPHSSTLAWKTPWMEEPGRLQSMRLLRVRHDWATSLSLFTFLHWRRKWQPTPVFLPGESQGWGSLVGCRLWGRTESDTTKVT